MHKDDPGWIAHQSALKNRLICGSFLFLFVYSLCIEFVHVFTLNLCIFVSHCIILNLLYKSVSSIILDFCSVLGIWVVIDIYCLDSYLGWLSVSFLTLEIDLEPTSTWVSEHNASVWLCYAERSSVWLHSCLLCYLGGREIIFFVIQWVSQFGLEMT